MSKRNTDDEDWASREDKFNDWVRNGNGHPAGRCPMSDNRDSLPSWTAGVQIARAWSGIRTGETSVEDLAAAVDDANRQREQEPQR